MSDEFGKLPPQAIEIEEAVLAACMLEQNAYDNVSAIISSDAFYKETHKKIFAAIGEMNLLSIKVDMLTLSEHLTQKGIIEEIGGPVYISQLTMKIANAVNVKQYAKIIHEKHIQREIIRYSSELCSSAYDDFEQAQTIYSAFTGNVDTLISGKSSIRNVTEIMGDSLKRLEERSKMPSSGITGIDTGLQKLNYKTKGWQPGNLIVLAARPAMGKTAIALNLFARTAAQNNKSVCFFSLEMDDVSLTDRLILSYGGLDKDRYKTGKLHPSEWSDLHNRIMPNFMNMNLWIDDNAGTNINYIKAVARTKARKGECDLVVIDYLQLIDSDVVKGETRDREVAKMTRALKVMAKELKIPVILLAQLNRGVEKRTGFGRAPVMSDLRESGSIEQDADLVIMPWRPEYYGMMEDMDGNSLENQILMEVTKNRDGETGAVIAMKNEQFTRIWGHDETQEAPHPADPYEGMENKELKF